MGAMLASLVGPMSDQIKGDSELIGRFQMIFPDFDLDATGGWLQLFVELMFIAIGFAGATFVSKWASDETDDRLEALLAYAPARARPGSSPVGSPRCWP